MLKTVLSSWVETLSSGHLETGFGMIKHVHDILADSKEVGLDIARAKDFVDGVIALRNKWNETKSFPDDDFFDETFMKQSSKVKAEMTEVTKARRQVVREKNVTELAIIGLQQDLDHLDKEVVEARQCLDLLEEEAAAKWTAIVEARDKERILIRQVEEAEGNVRRKNDEYEQWQVLWNELPRFADGSRRSAAFYGNILKKRGLQTLEVKAKSLLEELNFWLKTLSD